MSNLVISADGHIDLPCLPTSLFVEGASKSMRARMPHAIERDNGQLWVTAKGTPLGLVGGMGSAGRRYEPGQIHRADRMAETGLYADQARGIMRTAIPALRIKDQERDGVVGEVIYGILGATSRLDDPEAATCMVKIYNDFAASEFARPYPDRFAMIGCLPIAEPEVAAEETRRCAELGLKGVEIPVSDAMMPLWRDDWQPLWHALDETGLPLHLHTIGGKVDLSWVRGPEDRLKWLATHMTGFQMTMASQLAAIIFSGALERHPRARVVIGESGLGWIPYVLERMDYEWEDQFQNLELKMKPSDYWHRQMFATFQLDEIGIVLLDRIGVENVMWGSDFPHPDGVWPDSQEFLATQLADLSPESRRKVVHDNAACVYGFPN